MKSLLIYGFKWGWTNFESDCLLPYLKNTIQQIKIFHKITDLQNYLHNNSHNKNYVLPLDENHMDELRKVGIKGLMSNAETVDLFCNKQKFNFRQIKNMPSFALSMLSSVQPKEQKI
jgi:hypothetical protein